MNRYLALQKIVELGSFTRAAEALGYTQSAMSQMIASLEEELSIKLLIRSRTGARLTLEGAELYPYVERLVYQYWAAREKANEIKGLETGVVRMGTLASISVHWLPGLLRDFQARYPGVEFVIHQGDYTSIQEWIKTGAVDFGFVNPKAVSGLSLNTLPLFICISNNQNSAPANGYGQCTFSAQKGQVKDEQTSYCLDGILSLKANAATAFRQQNKKWL